MIIFGDCRETMRQWAKNGIKAQTCVTSPPYYGLRDYGHDGQIGLEETPEEYIKAMVEVFKCVWDVLEDNGTLWLNIGDSYYNYRPGKGQALVKQSVSNTNQDLPENCARRGNKLDGLKEKDLIGIPWMLAFALRADGWYLRQDIIWHKPNPMPESVQDRCTKAHEYIFLMSKSSKYYYDNESIKEKSVTSAENQIAKRNKEPHKGQRDSGMRETTAGFDKIDKVYETKNRRSVWTVTTKPYSGAHFATFPTDLIEPCIKAGCPEGGVVLDPFMGSGTTAYVAALNNRKYLGCELNPAYKPLQDERIKNAQMETAQMELI
jgi:DNA modification methylase